MGVFSPAMNLQKYIFNIDYILLLVKKGYNTLYLKGVI
ncbi:hypothetical protein MNB_SV-15-541 [hydrothermal vent metagenome]|uniref:Uncharacterized protein n=1 Tax=hydrothermal vent metagenome TaxID=652676 RepID=A0A1W1EJ44_9ZZZZ